MKAARVLITDDDAGIRTMVRVCLESSGYEVLEADNGMDALTAVKLDPPDLVLLDLAMPRMDGMTFLAELHALAPTPPSPVVVMTAHGSVKTAIRAMRWGASDFLEKPFTPDDLRLSVASVLDERKDAAGAGGPAGPGGAGGPPDPQAAGGFRGVLQQVREALKAGTISAAETKLMEAGTIADDEPEFLNLAGVLHELRGRVDSARRFYERAAKKDLNYAPAHDNLRRLGETRRTGKSRRAVAMGDDPREDPGDGPVDPGTAPGPEPVFRLPRR